ncbi:MAG: pseudouridine synthase [Desulfuromonadales bacterium]|nr:pseudouridine synthase [Desulfuromonadales bacterium]
MNMHVTEWQINLREENLSLLEALALRIPAAPGAFLRQLCKKQRVIVNKQSAEADSHVHAGDIIEVKASQRWQECLEQSHLEPGQILYEDVQCMVVNKPAGLAVHHALDHDDNLLLRIRSFLRLRGETFQVAPIHRLDIGTSGAVLFGKGRASISQLGQMVMAGEMTKHYLALVEGCISLSGELNSAVPAKGQMKSAFSRFRPVANTSQYTLLELELVTGRHHQIRHQLAAIGSPIIGDSRYRGTVVSDINRPFLHCHHLAFPQPATGKTVDIHCRLSSDLSMLLNSLGFSQSFLKEKH